MNLVNGKSQKSNSNFDFEINESFVLANRHLTLNRVNRLAKLAKFPELNDFSDIKNMVEMTHFKKIFLDWEYILEQDSIAENLEQNITCPKNPLSYSPCVLFNEVRYCNDLYSAGITLRGIDDFYIHWLEYGLQLGMGIPSGLKIKGRYSFRKVKPIKLIQLENPKKILGIVNPVHLQNRFDGKNLVCELLGLKID